MIVPIRWYLMFMVLLYRINFQYDLPIHVLEFCLKSRRAYPTSGNLLVFSILFVCFQDNVRNQLIQFELLLTTATFVVAIFGVVAGIFGMNFPIAMFDNPGAFKWVLMITSVIGIFIFCSFLWFFKHRRLMPL